MTKPMFDGLLNQRQIKLIRDLLSKETADARNDQLEYFCKEEKKKDDELIRLLDFFNQCIEANRAVDYIRFVNTDQARSQKQRNLNKEDARRLDKARNEARLCVQQAEETAQDIQFDFNHGYETI